MDAVLKSRGDVATEDRNTSRVNGLIERSNWSIALLREQAHSLVGIGIDIGIHVDTEIVFGVLTCPFTWALALVLTLASQVSLIVTSTLALELAMA